MKTYILSGTRTPTASFLGQLSSVSATQLGAVTLKATVERSGISPNLIDEVYMGQVVQAGCGQAPARQAAIFAGLPESIPCTTINKVCGSGLKAVIQGVQSILAGDNQLVLCGGMENMSLAPHLLPNSRTGFKYGEVSLKDATQWDGLWDVYSNRAMGNCAEEAVIKYKITREEQDQYAIESFKKSQGAIKEGIFRTEIAAVTIQNKSGNQVIDTDEGPSKVNFEKIPTLKPAFEKNGTITAANASTINDGASSLLIAGEKFKDKAKFEIVAYAGFAGNPTWFTTAPVEAMKKVSEKAKISIKDIELFEINEAFSMVPLIAIKEFNISADKVNVFGGGVSLGHPIGSSGARILVTLMNALERKNKRIGMASLCIGGGEALAMIIRRL